MYSYVSLTKKNIQPLIRLNKKRQQFNILNEDFWEYYSRLNLAKQFFAARSLKLLKYNNEIVGYLWLTRQNKSTMYIKSMFVDSEENLVENYGFLINGLKLGSSLIYNCEKNNVNYNILSKLGFIKKEGTYEMYAPVTTPPLAYENSDIAFEQFLKGKHEEIRCRIQNEAFRNDSRIPLTKEDILCDQLQSYYFEKGSVLIKKGDTYIGYGQIIFNGSIPTIVNVGLLEAYRGKGYGRALMLCLLRLLEENGIKEVNLRVATHNHKALKLYKSLGFAIKSEVHLWEYKK
jgi:ribosomal protein S18 acetylase RimI-like enzyme